MKKDFQNFHNCGNSGHSNHSPCQWVFQDRLSSPPGAWSSKQRFAFAISNEARWFRNLYSQVCNNRKVNPSSTIFWYYSTSIIHLFLEFCEKTHDFLQGDHFYDCLRTYKLLIKNLNIKTWRFHLLRISIRG